MYPVSSGCPEGADFLKKLLCLAGSTDDERILRFLELAGLVSAGRDPEARAHLVALTTRAGPVELV